jgi:hypothetical protein
LEDASWNDDCDLCSHDVWCRRVTRDLILAGNLLGLRSDVLDDLINRLLDTTVLVVQDLVVCLHVQRNALAIVVELAVAYGEDLPFWGFSFAVSGRTIPTDRRRGGWSSLERIAWLPAMPVSGHGRPTFHPIWARDAAALRTSDRDQPENGTRAAAPRHELAGPETLSHTDIVRTLLRSLHRRRPLVHVPTPAVSRGLRLLERMGSPGVFDDMRRG